MFNHFLRSHICLDRVAPLVAQQIPCFFWGNLCHFSSDIPQFPPGSISSGRGAISYRNVYSEASGQDLDNLTDSDATQTANRGNTVSAVQNEIMLVLKAMTHRWGSPGVGVAASYWKSDWDKTGCRTFNLVNPRINDPLSLDCFFFFFYIFYMIPNSRGILKFMNQTIGDGLFWLSSNNPTNRGTIIP